jgi:hypothetical protein
MTPADTTVTVAMAALNRLRRAADDIAARPQLYARALEEEPAVSERIAEFAQAWRTSSGAVATCALMARRPEPLRFDALAFVRLMGHDIGANPVAWVGLAATEPRFAEACARLAASLRAMLPMETPTACA